MSQADLFNEPATEASVNHVDRMPWAEAKAIADRIVEELRPSVQRIEIAGSLRRRTPTVGDIELVIIKDHEQIYRLIKIVDGWTFVKGKATGKYCQRILPEGIKLDLFFATADNWGNIFTIRTGSAEWSHGVLAKTWVRRGFRSVDGLLRPVLANGEDLGDPIPMREERDLFDFLGLAWVEPEDRNVK